MVDQNLRAISLVICTFAYLLIGSAVFEAIESTHERIQRSHWMREEQRIIEQLKQYNISEDDFEIIKDTIVKAAPYSGNIQWNFSGAFYFVTTVITTIGYGHATPKTTVGKMVCLVYAVFGVPLNIIMYGAVGDRINRMVSIALARLKRLVRAAPRCFRFRSVDYDVTQTDLTAAVGAMSAALLLCGAWGFSYFEQWSYEDAFYYGLITLSTIGFGDLVAMNGEASIYTRPEYATFGLVFIFVGLAVLSSAINLLVVRLTATTSGDDVITQDGDKNTIENEKKWPPPPLTKVLVVTSPASCHANDNDYNDVNRKKNENSYHGEKSSSKHCNGLTEINGSSGWNGVGFIDVDRCTPRCDQHHCIHM